MSVGSEGISLRCIQRNLFCVTLGKVHSFPRRHFEETMINCWRKSSLSKKKKSVQTVRSHRQGLALVLAAQPRGSALDIVGAGPVGGYLGEGRQLQ